MKTINDYLDEVIKRAQDAVEIALLEYEVAEAAFVDVVFLQHIARQEDENAIIDDLEASRTRATIAKNNVRVKKIRLEQLLKIKDRVGQDAQYRQQLFNDIERH